jgi:hypothetical protein
MFFPTVFPTPFRVAFSVLCASFKPDRHPAPVRNHKHTSKALSHLQQISGHLCSASKSCLITKHCLTVWPEWSKSQIQSGMTMIEAKMQIGSTRRFSAWPLAVFGIYERSRYKGRRPFPLHQLWVRLRWSRANLQLPGPRYMHITSPCEFQLSPTIEVPGFQYKGTSENHSKSGKNPIARNTSL